MNSAPDHNRDADRIALTPDMISALRAQRERTGVSVPGLVKNHLDPTRGITVRLVHCWMLGILEGVCLERYAHVLETWQGLPDRDDAYVFHTPAVRTIMEAEIRRTGISIPELVSGLTDMPDGLTFNRIRNFYCGQLKRLPRAHMDYIMSTLKALPDTNFEAIPLTPDILEMLRAHAVRTGKGPSALLRAARDKPDGLSSPLIHTWLSGKTVTARRDHLDYVLKRYDIPVPSDRIEITGALLEELRAHVRRTGKGPHALLRGVRDKPEGLTGNMIQNWMRGLVHTARKDHFDYVLTLWGSLPGRICRPGSSKNSPALTRFPVLRRQFRENDRLL